LNSIMYHVLNHRQVIKNIFFVHVHILLRVCNFNI